MNRFLVSEGVKASFVQKPNTENSLGHDDKRLKKTILFPRVRRSIKSKDIGPFISAAFVLIKHFRQRYDQTKSQRPHESQKTRQRFLADFRDLSQNTPTHSFPGGGTVNVFVSFFHDVGFLCFTDRIIGTHNTAAPLGDADKFPIHIAAVLVVGLSLCFHDKAFASTMDAKLALNDGSIRSTIFNIVAARPCCRVRT